MQGTHGKTEVALVQTSEDGTTGWVVESSSATGGTVRRATSKEAAATILSDESNDPPFSSFSPARFALQEKDRNVVVLPLSAPFILSGSLLANATKGSAALTATWSDGAGALIVWQSENARPWNGSVTLMKTAIPLTVMVMHPKDSIRTVRSLLDDLSPGIADGLTGILQHALREQFGPTFSMNTLSGALLHPGLVMMATSGSELTYAIGESAEPNEFALLWSGAIMRTADGTIRTIPLLRNQVRRDIAPSEPVVEKSTMDGWTRESLADRHDLFFASRAPYAAFSQSNDLMEAAMRLLPVASNISTDLAASFSVPWVQEMMQARLPFLMKDPALEPFLTLLPTDSFVSVEVHSDASQTTLAWKTATIQAD